MGDEKVTSTVTEFQGIDIQRLRKHFTEMNSDNYSVEDFIVRDDILELLDHVEADGLLDRVAAARKEMAEQVMPSIY